METPVSAHESLTVSSSEADDVQIAETGKLCNIVEQVIEDPVTDLTIEFEVMPYGDTKMRILGPNLRFGNREFIFDQNGILGATGTAVACNCRPPQLKIVNTEEL